jgi:PhnB protein
MQIMPYIIFNGNCEEALNFYAKTLNGEIKDLMRFEGAPVENMTDDKQKVMHSHFAVDGNNLFMASDTGFGGPMAAHGGMVHLSLNFTDSARIQQVFAAMSDGGKVTMPLQDTFWGATFGMLTDQYGVNWMFNYDKPRS